MEAPQRDAVCSRGPSFKVAHLVRGLWEETVCLCSTAFQTPPPHIHGSRDLLPNTEQRRRTNRIEQNRVLYAALQQYRAYRRKTKDEKSRNQNETEKEKKPRFPQFTASWIISSCLRPAHIYTSLSLHLLRSAEWWRRCHDEVQLRVHMLRESPISMRLRGSAHTCQELVHDGRGRLFVMTPSSCHVVISSALH